MLMRNGPRAQRLAAALILTLVALATQVAAEGPQIWGEQDKDQAAVAIAREGAEHGVDLASQTAEETAKSLPIEDGEQDTSADEEAQPQTDIDEAASSAGHLLSDEVLVAGITGIAATGVGLLGFALVTRYISPKEALSNPQRAMLYGFIRATPGSHLKQLSEEFRMKTSSILWHVRKLEAAELVHSDRVNGYRVFYPVEGGVEIKRVSRAMTALHNGNARRIFESIERRPGTTPKHLASRLELNPGTVRWHLRKLRDCGLIEELVMEQGSQVFGTPLGRKALEVAMGHAPDAIPVTLTPRSATRRVAAAIPTE